MQAISVEVSAAFGFFQWEKTKGDRRITNLFLSKTEALGILGAVIGLDGYAQCTFKEKHNVKSSPFYEVLSSLNITIIPCSVPTFFEDHLIHRSMHAINQKGALMVHITGLVKPSYRLIIEQGQIESVVFDKLVHYLENGWAEFIPYMGKNQFPVAFSNVQKVELTEVTNDEKRVIHSLCKQKYITEMDEIDEDDLYDEDFHYHETLRDFQGGTPIFLNEPHVWSSFKMKVNQPVFQTTDNQYVVFL